MYNGHMIECIQGQLQTVVCQDGASRCNVYADLFVCLVHSIVYSCLTTLQLTLFFVQEQAKHATMDVMLPSSENINKRNIPAGDNHYAGAYRAAPVTGISCELIEELPTMALPFSEGMLLSGSYDEECPFLL